MCRRKLIFALISFLTFIVFLLKAEIALGSGEEKLIFVAAWPIKTFDPSKGGGYSLVRYSIAETLIGVDQNGKLIPLLATSWNVGKDGKTWTIKLRENVKYHDGQKLNALKVASHLKRAFETFDNLKVVPIEDIGYEDDLTLTIKTKVPFSPLPAYLAFHEAAILSPDSFNEKGELTRVIGTGPYKLVSWEPLRDAILQRFEEYWGSKGKFKEIVLKSISEPQSRIPLILSGEADIAQLLPPQSLILLEKSQDIEIIKTPIARIRVLQLNCLKKPFNDKRMRLALQYAIDRESIDRELLNNSGVPAGGLFPPNLIWANESLKPYPYDLQRAMALIKEAGWEDLDKDGILEDVKTGEKLKIKLYTYPERAELPPLAEIIQQELSKLGFSVDLQVVSVGTISDIWKRGDFDAILMGRGLFFVPDPDFIFMTDYYSGRKEFGWGAYGWKNEDLDRLLELGRKTSDPNERLKIYKEAQRIIYEESPVIPIDYYVNIDAIRKGIKNYKGHVNEYCYFLEKIYREKR